MPQPCPPLTPATSTDIQAQEKHSSPDTVCVLPPAAMSSHPHSSAKYQLDPKKDDLVFSKPPSPPTSPPKRRFSNAGHKRALSGSHKIKLPEGAQMEISDLDSPLFALPPPPTRSRKIIQMTPKTTPQSQPHTSSASSSTSLSTPKSRRKNTSTAAGRKLARKTAHSIIERRRRSKMNEEFETLKEMIPACHGQEMHKLQILQAGIEYLTYLEGCVGDLKGRKKDNDPPYTSVPGKRKHSLDDEQGTIILPTAVHARVGTASGPVSESSPYLPPLSTTTSRSNSILTRTDSLASITTSTTSTPTTSTNPTLLTPAFNGMSLPNTNTRHDPNPSTTDPNSQASPRPIFSASSSPNILPMPAMMDLAFDHRDQEATATAALMMLTHDRRGVISRPGSSTAANTPVQNDKVFEIMKSETRRSRSRDKGSTKGMSVRDLLSS